MACMTSGASSVTLQSLYWRSSDNFSVPAESSRVNWCSPARGLEDEILESRSPKGEGGRRRRWAGGGRVGGCCDRPCAPTRSASGRPPSPFRAGLSHMTEHCHEEGVVPAGALDFAPYGCAIGVGLEDVEREPAQDSEVLGSIVLSCAISILGELNVEHPVELVLDGPMTARDLQQPLGGHIFGQEIMAHDRRVGAMAAQASARGDPAHRNDAGKAVERSQAGVAHDRRAPDFAPVVIGRFDLLGDTARAGACKLLRDGCEQAPTVGLDRQNRSEEHTSELQSHSDLVCRLLL